MASHRALVQGLRWAMWTALLLALPVFAQSNRPVLTAETAHQLELAFVQAPSGLVLDDAQISAERIAMRVCQPSGACAQLTLTQPAPPCAGETTPTFCLQWTGAIAPFRTQLLQVLARVPASVWQAPVATVQRPQSPWPDARPWLQLGLVALLLALAQLASRGVWGALLALVMVAAALAAWRVLPADDDRDWLAHQEILALGWEAIWWLVPLVLGLIAGSLARAWPRAKWPLLLLPASLALVPLFWRPLVFGDAWAMALVATLSGLWRSDLRPNPGRRWLLAATVTFAGLGALEATLRLAAPAPPVIDDARVELLQTPPLRTENARNLEQLQKPSPGDSTLAAWAEALFVPPERFRTLRARAPHGPWLLHLGDSLVYGTGLTAEQGVPAQIAPLLPAFAHVNAGLPGSSIDLQFALMLRLLRAWPAPAAVVLHVYPGNDLTGLDAPLDFCGGAPVLTLPPRDLAVACTAWQPQTLAQRLLHSPLPLPLVRAARWSWLARRIVAAHVAAQTPAQTQDVSGVARRYAQIAKEMQRILREKGIALNVAFMPVRPGTQHDGGAAARALQAAFAALQVNVLDSQALFDARAHAGQAQQLFQGEHDVHLTADGARVYASWLAPLLAGQIRAR